MVFIDSSDVHYQYTYGDSIDICNTRKQTTNVDNNNT